MYLIAYWVHVRGLKPIGNPKRTSVPEYMQFSTYFLVPIYTHPEGLRELTERELVSTGEPWLSGFAAITFEQSWLYCLHEYIF